MVLRVGAALLEVLDQLGEPERGAVVARLRPRHYRRSQVVFNEGDAADRLYLLQSGRMQVSATTLQGSTIILRVVQPGEMFGALALVQPDHRRTARVCALEDCAALTLERRDFDELRLLHPGVDRLLVSVLTEQLVRSNALAAELLLPPEIRVWRRLHVLAQAYGDDPIRMSQDDLAHAAGTVRQTANRVLQIGVRERSLAVERGVVRILDSVAIEAHSSAD